MLFTWPSGGNVTDYVYDRDSAMYSRDALEAVLQALVKDPNVDSISILAHSMGNYLAIESLRQMSIRDRGLSPKIRDVMLASPDIDVDVFRRQIAEIDAGPRPAQFTLFVSRDDRALGLSSFSPAIRPAWARSTPPRSLTARSLSKAGCKSST